jgi:hypothetical protein
MMGSAARVFDGSAAADDADGAVRRQEVDGMQQPQEQF